MFHDLNVAIVIPALNEADTIGPCVEACRIQTRLPDEVIVVDNGSTDATAHIARDAGARVVVAPRRGISSAQNAGWRATEADVIARTDADCVPQPSWLEHLVAPFGDPGVAMTAGEIRQRDTSRPTQRWLVSRKVIDQAHNVDHPFLPFAATANAAFRRSALVAVGGWDEELSASEDCDIAWRIQLATGGTLHYCAEAVVDHDVAPDLGEVTGRMYRYTRGDVLVAKKWAAVDGFVPVPGFWRRTKAVWTLPGRLVVRAARRRPVADVLLDLVGSISAERGVMSGWLARGQVTALPVDYVRSSRSSGSDGTTAT